MAYLNDAALDAGLAWIITNGTSLHVCSAEPTSYAEIATYELGVKSGITIGSQEAGDTDGRKVVVPAVTDGTVGTAGTCTHYAISNGTDTLVATKATASSVSLSTSFDFQTPAFDLTIRDAT